MQREFSNQKTKNPSKAKVHQFYLILLAILKETLISYFHKAFDVVYLRIDTFKPIGKVVFRSCHK